MIEHVDDDERALAELSRVASPGAALITSVPLHYLPEVKSASEMAFVREEAADAEVDIEGPAPGG